MPEFIFAQLVSECVVPSAKKKHKKVCLLRPLALTIKTNLLSLTPNLKTMSFVGVRISKSVLTLLVECIFTSLLYFMANSKTLLHTHTETHTIWSPVASSVMLHKHTPTRVTIPLCFFLFYPSTTGLLMLSQSGISQTTTPSRRTSLRHPGGQPLPRAAPASSGEAVHSVSPSWTGEMLLNF